MKSAAIHVEPLPGFLVVAAVERALEEDMGRAGDLTTAATIPATAQARALLVPREKGRLAGTQFLRAAFNTLDPAVNVQVQVPDGADVEPGETIAIISGSARPILTGERVGLNFLGRLSGVATATSNLVRLVSGTGVRVVCTRKTTPGLRAFEKYAVRCGGGFNHRFALDDGILIKDNHIVAAGGVTRAIQSARAHAGHMIHVEIEVDSLAQMEEALNAGANSILLDNMSPDTLREAVKLNKGRALLEASGNINAQTIAAVAATGVNLISSGAITHSAKCLDIGLDFQAV
jgi:nicotinate-nucleotide pyrophosphorylase (carboxylating)